MKLNSPISLVVASLVLAASAPEARAYWVDGEGHYALRGVTETAPGFSKKSGTYQAIEQSFRLMGEARVSDQASMFLELRLFDDPRRAFLGDTVENKNPIPCETRVDRAPGEAEPPEGRRPCDHQDTGQPGYKSYTPRVTQAFVRYGFDYCLLEAGRRGRDWGLGIFLDSGSDPFEYTQSIYDGVTCNVNIQKSQTLGFAVGYDKLAETGAYVNVPEKSSVDRKFGPNDSGDDLDQLYFTIEFDDRKANAGSPFTKQIGVYFAQVNGVELKKGGSNTDLKFLDLYTGFFFSDLAIRNELLFRMGKSADPNWIRLGGAADRDNSVVTNKLQAIALAGNIEWTVSRSGAPIGPVEYNQGDASRHVIFFNYGYAPGDADGYLPASQNAQSQRDTTASALAFNANYKPALILFNGRPDADKDPSLNVDGAFSPSRVVNATVFSTGYRYESQKNGNFEAKVITANMNQQPSGTAKELAAPRDTASDGTTTLWPKCTAEMIAAGEKKCDDGHRPAGTFGRSLGYELDLAYSYKVGREAEIGTAVGAALPGDAWKTQEDVKPVANMMIQAFGVFKF